MDRSNEMQLMQKKKKKAFIPLCHIKLQRSYNFIKDSITLVALIVAIVYVCATYHIQELIYSFIRYLFVIMGKRYITYNIST